MLKRNTLKRVKALDKGNKHFLDGLTTYAKCYKVIDGDTIKVCFYLDKVPVNYNIRLLHINTPEKKQEGFQEATDRTKGLVEGQVVKLKLGKFDAFGRNLAEVYTLDGVCVNDVLLSEGLAVEFKK